MNKTLKYCLGLIALVLLAYNSVYFTDLDEMKAIQESGIDFSQKATELYEDILSKSSNLEVATLAAELSSDVDSTFAKYGNRLGIGNSAYFMVAADGIITKINGGELELKTNDGRNIKVETKFIFGNAIRDASGLVALTDYKTNAEFNKLSEALNTHIREQVIPASITGLQVNDQVKVVGALKLSKSEPLNNQMEILPVSIQK